MAQWGEVLSIKEYSALGDRGEVEEWVRITAKTRLGTVFTERMKKTDATPAAVEKHLAAKAAEWDKIKSL